MTSVEANRPPTILFSNTPLVTPHLWLNSSEDLFGPPVCASAEKINCMFSKQIIDIDSLFDEHVLMKNYNSANDRRERWKNTPISYE